MLEKQAQHCILLGLLLIAVSLFARGDVLAGQLWGMETETWLWLAIAIPVIHHIFVGLLWRAELYYHTMTDWFGHRAIDVFKTIFTILLIGRPISLILLGISNRNTLITELPDIRRIYGTQSHQGDKEPA